MSTVSSSSSFSTSRATSHGMSGLMSGLDTEGMVESMLAGTQNKIDKQNAEKQQIIWKQLMYREIIADLNSFQNMFFGKSGSLSSLSFFNSMSAITSSKAFSVTASSEASTGRTSVQVGQLATATSMKSGSEVSGALEGSMDLTALERRVVFDIGGTEVTVNLTSVPKTKVDASGRTVAMTDQERLEHLAQQLNDNADFQAAGATAEIKDGKLQLNGEIKVSAKSSSLGLSMLGVAAGRKSNEGSITSTANVDAAVSFTMSLNGLTRTITLDGVNSGIGEADLQDEIQNRIDNAFGKGWVDVTVSGGEFSLQTKGKGNVAVITGDKSGLTLLGVQDGESNKINQGQMLKNLNFNEKLQGSNFSFTINGKEFSFNGNNTLGDVIKAVNNSGAGVRITYNEIEDKFSIESTNTGAGYSISMEQTEGNLLNAMFGKIVNSDGTEVTTGKKASSNALATNKLQGSTDFGMNASGFSTGTFRLNVNGTAYSIYVPAKASGTYTRDEVMELVNEGLASRFGYQGSQQSIELVGDSVDGYSLEVRNGATVTFDDLTAGMNPDATTDERNKGLDALAKTNLQAAFGFNNTSNILADSAAATTSLSEVGFNFSGNITVGATTLSASSTVQDLIDSLTAVGFDVAFEGGKLILDARSVPAQLHIPPELSSLFGVQELNLGAASTGDEAAVTEGQNAVVNVNGVTIERSTNTFTVGGLTISVTDTTGQIARFNPGTGGTWTDGDGTVYTLGTSGEILNADGDEVEAFKGMTIDADGYLTKDGSKVILGEADTITTSRNTEQIFEGLKSFVEKYNSLIEKLNGKVDEEATYKDYPPLTSAQKKEMSEREIELWEEKAKEGLLRRDSHISSLLSSMRSILYTKPEGCEYALYNIGIDTSNEWRDKGKLVLDEAKLKSMIESNPQAIQELFLGAQDSISSAMDKALNAAANTSSASAGSLVELAGVEGKASNITNTLTKRLISINERIKDLERKYQKEKSRYWAKFNAMEVALSNLNSQSMWLTQQFS